MLSALSWVAIIKLAISPFRPELHNHTWNFSLSINYTSIYNWSFKVLVVFLGGGGSHSGLQQNTVLVRTSVTASSQA
jgi:hypothetical protein